MARRYGYAHSEHGDGVIFDIFSMVASLIDPCYNLWVKEDDYDTRPNTS